MINIKISLEEIKTQIRHNIPFDVTVHDAYLTAIREVGDQVVMFGIVVYEYEDTEIDEIIYMAYEFQRINGFDYIDFVEATLDIGGYDTLDDLEADLFELKGLVKIK